jgi:uncharacterized repeat protein (TIGR01451 family)
MFHEIVSNLSFSPSAASQLTYYWRRLKKEQLTRTLSMVMAVGLVGLQFATIVAPPDAVNASSSNDIIPGGINAAHHPQQTMLSIYDSNAEIRALLNHYGVYKIDIQNTKHGTLNSSNHHLKSLGRNPHSAQDDKVSVGGHTYYIRPLYTWGDNITYDVIEGRRHGDDKYFAIMYNCGNLVVTDTTPTTTVSTPIVSKPTPAPPVTPTFHPTPTPPPKVTTTTPTPPPPTTPTPPPVTPPTPTPPTPVPGNPKITQLKSGVIVAANGAKRDANGATALAGEVIEYTLTTNNTGDAAQKDYVVSENLNDDLEYADLIDGRGGVLTDGIISWPKTTIKAGQSYLATYQLRVKNPIPVTPASISDPQSFDLKMDNIYGNLVSTHLSIPAEKQVEVASAALPQTGPATSTVVVVVLLGLISFFYFRNRQLVTELTILRGDQHGPGAQ